MILSSKARSSKTKKKSKRKEIQLEAFSVSENFDPETYIIPLQNKWTFESDNNRTSDVSNNDESRLISNGFAGKMVGLNATIIFLKGIYCLALVRIECEIGHYCCIRSSLV